MVDAYGRYHGEQPGSFPRGNRSHHRLSSPIGKANRTFDFIDIGKTHAKLNIDDSESGNELASRKIANRVVSGAPYPHYDTDALWRFIQEGLAGLNNGPGYHA